MTVNGREVAGSYRKLYRQALHAVQYSSPARYTVRDHLRLAFRSNAPETFDSSRIANTLLFLKYAADERGLEHRLLKTLVHVWWWQGYRHKQRKEYGSMAALVIPLMSI